MIEHRAALGDLANRCRDFEERIRTEQQRTSAEAVDKLERPGSPSLPSTLSSRPPFLRPASLPARPHSQMTRLVDFAKKYLSFRERDGNHGASI